MEAECEKLGIILDNGESAAKMGIKLAGNRDWYRPYSNLHGPFSFKHRELFDEFTNGDFTYLMANLLSSPPASKLREQRRKAAEAAAREAARDAMVPVEAAKGKGGWFGRKRRSEAAAAEAAAEAEAAAAAAASDAPDPGRGCGFDPDRLATSTDGQNAHVLEFFTLHHPGERAGLHAKWFTWGWPGALPIDDINEYLGKEVAFYFAFLRQLTVGLAYLCPVALLAQVAAIVGAAGLGWRAQYVESLFCVVGTASYAVVLDAWRYEQSSVSHLWGVFGFTAHVSLRTEHVNASVVQRHPATGALVHEFPPARARRSRLFSQLVTLVCVAVLLGTVLALFAWKSALEAAGASATMQLMPAVLNTLQVSVFGVLYQGVAEHLTNLENHRTAAEHNEELFRKLTFFYFINYYASLFYVAFFKGSMSAGGCLDPLTGSTSCGRELATQTAVLFLSNDFGWRIFASLGMPALISWAKQTFNDLDESKMDPVELQFVTMGRYDPTSSLVIDYIELFVQWGYLVLFGASMPLAVCLSFLTDYVECRSDGYKLLYDFRRVMPRRIPDIGETTNVFYTVLYISIPVNAGLVVYTFGFFDAWGATDRQKSWLFVLVCFGLAYWIQRMALVFPDVPKRTEVQLARQRLIHARVIHAAGEEKADLQLGLDGLEIGQTTEAMALRGDAGEVDISVKQSDLRCFVEEGGKRKMTQNFALP